MKYRKFGNLDWDVSVLGYDLTGFSLTDSAHDEVNESEQNKMIRHAIDRGINYIDLGYTTDIGRIEKNSRTTGRALKDGYGQKVRVAATIPYELYNSKNDVETFLNKQLEWLQSEKLDFLILGRLTRDNWPEIERMDILSWADKATQDGRVVNLGFSFHDHFQILRDIITAYDNWSLCQFQHSYMDVDHDPGLSGIRFAGKEGLAVVISEPLKWGRLTKKLPESAEMLWAGAEKKQTLTQRGLNWVWNIHEVTTVVCNMSTIEQIDEYADLADSAEHDCLDVMDELLYSRVRDAYHELKTIPCTSCRACMPCLMGMDVPRIFELYNDAVMYDDVKTAQLIYSMERHDIGSCIECGTCAANCAKQLPVLDYLEKARKMFADVTH